MTQLVAANCPHCSAGLQVDPGQQWATCQYCGQSSYVQTPNAPPPPTGTMTIQLNVPGAIPMQVSVSPADVGQAPIPGVAPGMATPAQQHMQAAQAAQMRVAQAQMFAAQQMSSAYQQAGTRIAVGTLVAVIGSVIAMVVIGVVVAVAIFLAA